jgi:RNA 3'-terminal phosphate cyclase (ATP)
VSDFARIDASYGEGGGQVLRTCLSLSAMTGRPVEIVNIRAGRSKPGLQRQHLAAVQAAAAICGASLEGSEPGSQELWFIPSHPILAGEYRFDIGTAGATTLVAQTVIIPLSLAEGQSRVTILGGTHNPMAPTADYLEQVYASTLRKHGYDFQTSYHPAGFYPQGGGQLIVEVSGVGESLPAFRLSLREEAELRAVIMSNNLDGSVADRGGEALQQLGTVHVSKRIDRARSTGIAVTVHTLHAGFCSLGERGKPVEMVAQDAVTEASSWLASGATVDEHLADQLVLPALFATGESSWTTNRVTDHLRTVLWTAGHFVDFEFDLNEDSGTVTILSSFNRRIP